jgi:hypothetical protein
MSDGGTDSPDGGAPPGGTTDQAGDGSGSPDGGAPPGGTGTGSSTTDAGATTTGTGASSQGGAGSHSGTGSGSGSGCGCTFCNADNQAAAARGGQSTNGSGSPPQSPCLGQGPPQQYTMPPSRPLTTTESVLFTAITTGATVLPGGGVVAALTAVGSIAVSMGNTVAIGIGADAIGIAGGSAGTGMYFGPNGEKGWYGGAGLDVGWALGLSAEVIYTIIAGAPNVNFKGDCYSVNLSGGEVVVVGGAAIFSTAGKFVGVSVSAGIGAGAPVALYGQLSHTWITSDDGS